MKQQRRRYKQWDLTSTVCVLTVSPLPVTWFWLWPPVWAREGTCWWFWWGRTQWCLRSPACGTLPHSDRLWGWWGPPRSWSSSLNRKQTLFNKLKDGTGAKNNGSALRFVFPAKTQSQISLHICRCCICLRLKWKLVAILPVKVSLEV